MNDVIDISTGLRVPIQIPLDAKAYCKSELDLQNLGPLNNLAFTYHDGLIIFCFEERTRWEWREKTPEEVGLLLIDFTYPTNWIVYDVNYSLKIFNFFKVQDSRAPYTPFKFVQKGFGNLNLYANEIGDIFCGWSNDGTIRYPEAKWLGGSIADSENFLPLVEIQL